MRFLLLLFWAFLALVLLVFAGRNWNDVTLVLWGDLRLDIKLPLLIGLIALVTWLATWLPMRGRLWQVRRRLAQVETPIANPPAPTATTDPAGGE